MWYEQLVHLNAFLNATSAVLLAFGYAAIRRKRVVVHARFMVAAFAVSTLFLASYLTYHALAGHKEYAGPARSLYLALLLSHIVLAAATVPLALATLYLAARGRFVRHARLARWTFPIWMYVSVTGVVVYILLHVR